MHIAIPCKTIDLEVCRKLFVNWSLTYATKNYKKLQHDKQFFGPIKKVLGELDRLQIEKSDTYLYFEGSVYSSDSQNPEDFRKCIKIGGVSTVLTYSWEDCRIRHLLVRSKNCLMNCTVVQMKIVKRMAKKDVVI